jgi:uncharacterized protein (TIGR02646 family)
MIELQHLKPEPDELRNHRNANPGGSWDDPTFRTVRPIVRHQLNLEQEGLCVYCERLLNEDEGHLEHIKRKGVPANRHLTFVYDNLAHSCDGPGHCGHNKKGEVLPVEPRPGCNRFFVVMALDGRIVAASGLTGAEAQHAADTLRILGLNVPALAWQRKGFADTILNLSPADKAVFIATAPFRWALQGL